MSNLMISAFQNLSYFEIRRLLKGAREESRISQTFRYNSAIPFHSKVQEIVHLSDNWCSGFGEVERVRIFNAAQVI